MTLRALNPLKKEAVMINAIGEAAMQQTIRPNFNSTVQDQALLVQKSHQIRKQRPVEKAHDGQRSEMNMQYQEDIRTKNIFENGQLIVEKYTEDGKLIRKIPPGYLPVGEKA